MRVCVFQSGRIVFLTGLAAFLLNTAAFAAGFGTRLAASARALTVQRVVYDPAYYAIPYPAGDIPSGKGVCTDVVIRAYRALGIDLQKAVHEDVLKNRPAYRRVQRPDASIDHRRVPNLMVFFSRYGQSLSRLPVDSLYRAGDVVCWDLGGGVLHTGIVVLQGAKPWIVHNIGSGQVLEDCLFHWTVIGHYRYPA